MKTIVQLCGVGFDLHACILLLRVAMRHTRDESLRMPALRKPGSMCVGILLHVYICLG